MSLDIEQGADLYLDIMRLVDEMVDKSNLYHKVYIDECMNVVFLTLKQVKVFLLWNMTNCPDHKIKQYFNINALFFAKSYDDVMRLILRDDEIRLKIAKLVLKIKEEFIRRGFPYLA